MIINILKVSPVLWHRYQYIQTYNIEPPKQLKTPTDHFLVDCGANNRKKRQIKQKMMVSVWWFCCHLVSLLKMQWSAAAEVSVVWPLAVKPSNGPPALESFTMKCIDTCQQQSDHLRPLRCDLVALIRGGNSRKKQSFPAQRWRECSDRGPRYWKQKFRGSLLIHPTCSSRTDLSSEAHFAASLKLQPHASAVFGSVGCLSPHLRKSFRRFLWTEEVVLARRQEGDSSRLHVRVSGHGAVIFRHATKMWAQWKVCRHLAFFFLQETKINVKLDITIIIHSAGEITGSQTNSVY